MSSQGGLLLAFQEAAIKSPPRIKDQVEIQLRHPTKNQTIHQGIHDGSADIEILGLPAVPWGWYELLVFPLRYHVVHQFVQVQAARVTPYTFTLPKRTNSVQPVFDPVPKGVQEILDASGMAWDNLGDLQKAGLLNLWAKMTDIRVDGKRTFAYVEELIEVRQARIIALIAESLLAQVVKNTGADKRFRKESDLLHHPPEGFSRAGSFKTREDFGNLQLTFFHNGLHFAIDADIDDFGGLAHAYQVLRNWARRSDTHPYDIHEILVAQKIDPAYELEVV